jgi:hypothetical protein
MLRRDGREAGQPKEREGIMGDDYLDDYLIAKAQKLLKENEGYYEDARNGVVVANTAIGAVLALVYGCPRWAAEDAVAEALRRMRDPEAA